MKKQFLLMFSLVLVFTLTLSGQAAPVCKHYLHSNWRFRESGSELWYPAKVPGCVHLDLMSNRIIEDPFFRMNDRSVQWIDKIDWMYETHFSPTGSELDAEHQTIIFKGLDTYADVYLNYKQIATTDNMHREWRCNVKGILREGDNLLEVYFHSPVKRNLPHFDALPYHHNTGPDHSQLGGIFDKTLSPFARTAAFEYGWDWGSRFVTSGIWRPVYLETWNDARIADAWYIQKKVNRQQACLQTIVTVEASRPEKNALIDITANGKKIVRTMANLKAGSNTIALDYTIRHPHLWWTNGLGNPYLYDFKVNLKDKKGELIDQKQDSIGIRSLKLHNDKDRYGHNLYFELNGQPLYVKGSNMVPNDNFMSRCTDSVYYKVVKDAHDVNMNMIRVWGGGVYEDDAFYKYCDHMGILVWQDFMFACSTYEVDSVFLSTIRQEAIYNVKRLRNHACLALYTGNNEEQDVWFGWGGKQKYFASLGQEQRVWNMQHSIFYELLPPIVKEYGAVPYRPSSPWAFENTPSDGVNGDDHFWGVWHGAQPFEAYFTHHVRFESEYGFQSFPEYESVLKYAPDSIDHNIYSSVMMEHQNAGTYANRRIEEYMNNYYRKPKDFKDFLYVGQVMQADGVKMGMEAFRRDKPYCMGSLVWQLNDCWPVASWSSRDYYGRWKALHYVTRKAYDDILISPYVKDLSQKEHTVEGQVAALPIGEVTRLDKAPDPVVANKVMDIKLVNDRRQAVHGRYRLETITLDGKVVYSREKKLTLPNNTAISLNNIRIDDILAGQQPGNVIFYMTFTTGDKMYDNIAYAVKQKDMLYRHPNIITKIVPASDGYDVTLRTDIFARAVFLKIKGIDNFFSDNYFDMLPGSQHNIHVRTHKDLNTFRHELEITTLADSYSHL